MELQLDKLYKHTVLNEELAKRGLPATRNTMHVYVRRGIITPPEVGTYTGAQIIANIERIVEYRKQVDENKRRPKK